MNDEEVIERLREVRDQFEPESDEYADVSMTIEYLAAPEYWGVDQ